MARRRQTGQTGLLKPVGQTAPKLTERADHATAGSAEATSASTGSCRATGRGGVNAQRVGYRPARLGSSWGGGDEQPTAAGAAPLGEAAVRAPAARTTPAAA